MEETRIQTSSVATGGGKQSIKGAKQKVSCEGSSVDFVIIKKNVFSFF